MSRLSLWSMDRETPGLRMCCTHSASASVHECSRKQVCYIISPSDSDEGPGSTNLRRPVNEWAPRYEETVKCRENALEAGLKASAARIEETFVGAQARHEAISNGS